MSEALYGDAGFYLAAGAAGGNFRTSAHVSPPWAAAIHRLATRVDAALGCPDDFVLADVGAGGGELLTRLADLAPERWSLCGVDVTPRPATLPARVSWHHNPPERLVGLVLAVERLDVVPIDIAELTDDGARVLTVSPSGAEKLGELVADRDADWLATWWPLRALGDRAEIGWPRDDVWRSLTARLDRGAAIAIDYAAVPSRDAGGTLTAYRDGRQVLPVPDGSCDLTAHVLFESLVVEGDVVTSQREALRSLGVSGRLPGYDGDPAAYLGELQATGQAAELLDPGGLGGFTWLIHSRAMPAPIRSM
jgi:SAM-dependent MidA family methyltransferase